MAPRQLALPGMGQDHIERAYLVWKSENPAIMDAFRRITREVAARRAHYGIKSIAERVRWHVEVEKGDAFKINNNYPSLIARDLVAEGVVAPNFFEFRERRSA